MLMVVEIWNSSFGSELADTRRLELARVCVCVCACVCAGAYLVNWGPQVNIGMGPYTFALIYLEINLEGV